MEPRESERGDVIRITREEAMSLHVEEMLERHRQLRGTPGARQAHERRWYYQNWFVFTVAGLIAAVAAWGIIEPNYNDLEYVQGEIRGIETENTLPARKPRNLPQILGKIELGNDVVYVLRSTRVAAPGSAGAPVDLSSLQVGQRIGVHADYVPVIGEEDMAIAVVLDPAPPQRLPRRPGASLFELHRRSSVMGFLFFPIVAGLIGLLIGAADGILCRQPRRAVLAGGVGLVVGGLGGFFSNFLGGMVYAPLSIFAHMRQDASGSMSMFGFMVQTIGRGLAWSVAGVAMGLGQGIALRSRRLLHYGLLGGMIGGLVGGLLFDPIDMLLGIGVVQTSAHWSRLVAITIIGVGVGAGIGIVELMARDAWLRMTHGPLAGKEFLLFKDSMRIGASPRCEIYLFNDPKVADLHAVLRAVGDDCEIENLGPERPVQLNHRPIRTSRLRHGDEITVGDAAFVFQKRRS